MPSTADGSLGARRVFSDEAMPALRRLGHRQRGYLWNARFAGGCLIRFAPDGRVDRVVDLPVSNPTCCCFGGPDLKTLYVTSARFGLRAEQIADNPAEGALLAIAVDVPGTTIGAVCRLTRLTRQRCRAWLRRRAANRRSDR